MLNIFYLLLYLQMEMMNKYQQYEDYTSYWLLGWSTHLHSADRRHFCDIPCCCFVMWQSCDVKRGPITIWVQTLFLRTTWIIVKSIQIKKLLWLTGKGWSMRCQDWAGLTGRLGIFFLQRGSMSVLKTLW